MPALALDYADLAEVNPRIIYVAMPGYGKSGPYQDRVAFGPYRGADVWPHFGDGATARMNRAIPRWR